MIPALPTMASGASFLGEGLKELAGGDAAPSSALATTGGTGDINVNVGTPGRTFKEQVMMNGLYIFAGIYLVKTVFKK